MTDKQLLFDFIFKKFAERMPNGEGENLVRVMIYKYSSVIKEYVSKSLTMPSTSDLREFKNTLGPLTEDEKELIDDLIYIQFLLRNKVYMDNVKQETDNYFISMDRLSKQLTNKEYITNACLPFKEDKEGTATCSLLFVSDEDKAIQNFKITDFDMMMIEACSSLFMAGNRIITDNMIFHILTQSNSSTKGFSDKWREAIRESMMKLRKQDVEFDLTETFEKYPNMKKYIVKSRFVSELISCKIIEVEFKNGTIQRGYELRELPILFQIAKAKSLNQIDEIPSEMLSLPVRQNVENTRLAMFIIKKVKVASRMKLKKIDIKLKDVYEELSRETRKQQRTTKANTKELLEDLQEKQLFKSFSENDNGFKIIL